jgi:hypothetical protein
MKFDIWVFFQIFVEKIQFPLKSDKNNRYFTWRPLYIFIISHSLLPRMKNVSDTVVHKFKNTYVMLKSRIIYELWFNIVELNRPRLTIWRMSVARWIPKATNTQSEYVLLISLPMQQWLHESASMLRYVYTVFCITEVDSVDCLVGP